MPDAREGHGALAAAHHLLLGHELAVRAMRETIRPTHRFGIGLNHRHVIRIRSMNPVVEQ
ncbi:hypothetical protein [Nocardia sp. CA-119907]|uniref:hypothetical protein n=1 Tax=Nocardia sp. CA-119907 TaxID=3239973 RepID=UPI003D96C2B2